MLSQKCEVLGCDVLELQEARRPGRTEFAAAGYNVFSSGEDGSSGRAGQHGVGLVAKGLIVREATWTQELMNERLVSVVGRDRMSEASGRGVYRPRSYVDTGAYERAPDVDDFQLGDTSNAITFIVAYGPTDTVSNTREQKDAVWEDFNSPVSRVSSSDYLFL